MENNSLFIISTSRILGKEGAPKWCISRGPRELNL